MDGVLVIRASRFEFNYLTICSPVESTQTCAALNQKAAGNIAFMEKRGSSPCWNSFEEEHYAGISRLDSTIMLERSGAH
jgi:hypothetical protein